MAELIQIEKEHLDGLAEAVEQQQRELESERKKRIAAEESATASGFKRGGYGMFNRPARWEAMRRSNAPDWVKVAEYCITHHGQDGHCRISGDFGTTVLGKGMKAPNVTRSVKRAVDEGLLAEGSNSRCLVAPYWSRYMTTADVWSDCNQH